MIHMTHKVSDAQKRAVRKYDDTHTKKIMLKLNIDTDRDILDKLERVDNKQGYIKNLIRKDLGE